MLAPMALASGVDGPGVIAPLALNLNGAAITLSSRLARAVAANGLAGLVRRRAEEGASQLTFAVVFPQSLHNLLLRAWLTEAGLDPDADVRITVAAPPRMAELLRDGVIEGFCAGEPWNAAAVAAGDGVVAARAADLLPDAPDKVLGVRAGWALANAETLQAVVRAVLRAAAWIEQPGSRAEFLALMALPEHLGADPSIIGAGLGDIRFHRDSAADPTQARGTWLAGEMGRLGLLPPGSDAAALSARVFRSDLYAQALGALRA